jgi:hypothetical protein
MDVNVLHRDLCWSPACYFGLLLWAVNSGQITPAGRGLRVVPFGLPLLPHHVMKTPAMKSLHPAGKPARGRREPRQPLANQLVHDALVLSDTKERLNARGASSDDLGGTQSYKTLYMQAIDEGGSNFNAPFTRSETPRTSSRRVDTLI